MTTWRMPAETEPHERTWMAWPNAPYTLGETPAEAEAAWTAWARVANAIVEHEPVTVLVPPDGIADARRFLSGAVDVEACLLDDAWYRDIGPTFVLGPDGLGAVNWVFNGWGGQDWARWEHDGVASEAATRLSGAAPITSAMVNEGGGLHTDGQGTFLLTRTVQLDPGRNPGWTETQVEAELARTLGARKVIWLPRGLTRDNERYGTRGHVDLLATFAAPGRLLVHVQPDQDHPDAAITAENLAVLADATDADGKPFEIVELTAPETTRDADGWVDYSYVNHYALNGAVVACTFDDPRDADALAVLAEAYPGREVIGVDARELFVRGGGVHCITQQQPAVRAGAAGAAGAESEAVIEAATDGGPA
ncbi:agmatine deiminase [Mumia flava]|uniref:Agmatine deiminase n=1 Tax=Mumia flava TaxID=1348852 RepID=A0A2M9ARG7_9ACTN|nr:agmatine deiminase family protein [Mumia flava]PJJ48278.1 agmatine deiminase [Mumia flava]